jgi:hypothetical protein
MRLVKTIPIKGERGIKKNDGESEFNYGIL